MARGLEAGPLLLILQGTNRYLFGRDTHDRCDIDARARAALDEGWCSSIGQACERGDVERDDLLHLLNAPIQQQRDGGGPGVVDEHSNARMLP